MDNKKGFTLIEVMATVIIIATISLISYPVLTNVLKNNEKIEDETFNENVILAAKSYFNINKDSIDLENQNKVSVQVNTLVEDDYLDYDKKYKDRYDDEVECLIKDKKIKDCYLQQKND